MQRVRLYLDLRARSAVASARLLGATLTSVGQDFQRRAYEYELRQLERENRR